MIESRSYIKVWRFLDKTNIGTKNVIKYHK